MTRMTRIADQVATAELISVSDWEITTVSELCMLSSSVSILHHVRL
jgi:hypothetical protein